MIGEDYFLEDFPVGTKVVRKPFSRTQNNEIEPLQTVGIIQSYEDLFDDKNYGYCNVKVLWEAGNETKAILSSLIRHEDVQAYIKQENDFKAIKVALLENFVAFGDDNMGTSEEWFNLDMATDRKVALMHACVPLKNVHIYDKLSVEELQSLKHHVRAMEGA